MGRARNQDETVVVSANGVSAGWNPQIGFMGDSPLVTRARSAAVWNMTVTLHPLLPTVTASSDNSLGAYASLSWAAGGREMLVVAPAEVMTFFDNLEDDEIDLVPEGQIEVLDGSSEV